MRYLAVAPTVAGPAMAVRPPEPRSGKSADEP